MDYAEYAKIDAVNFSSLKWMRRSPAHYRNHLLEGDEDTAAKRFGRAVHVACFEPERFASTFAIWPKENGRRFGKLWNAFVREHGTEVLTEDEHAECLALQRAVRGDATAMKYITGGQGEQVIQWTDEPTGLKCKARLDYMAPKWLLDLKTTKDASPSGFARETYRYGYHAQAAHYVDGYAAANGGQLLPYVIIAVEKEPPHIVQVFHIPEATLEAGRAQIRDWLNLLSFSRANDVWPGYADGEVELMLPTWAVGASDEDEDVTGLDLVVGSES